jgi:ACT domain-containing protein
VAILGTVFLIIIIWIMKYANNDEKLNNLHIEVEFVQNSKSTLNSLVEILKSYCLKVDLKRFDHIENKVSAVFTVAFDDYENIEKVVKELKLLDKKVSLSFFEI